MTILYTSTTSWHYTLVQTSDEDLLLTTKSGYHVVIELHTLQVWSNITHYRVANGIVMYHCVTTRAIDVTLTIDTHVILGTVWPSPFLITLMLRNNVYSERLSAHVNVEHDFNWCCQSRVDICETMIQNGDG